MIKLKKTFEKIHFWLNCARLYSAPITILSWLVIFVYAIKDGGNIFNGLLALIGICLVHLATNLIDDYIDYKELSKDKEFIKAGRDHKCDYLRKNLATVKDLKNVIIIMLLIAAAIGGVLFLLSGPTVIIFAIIGLLIALAYPKFSMNGLGEVLVIIAYGPLLFAGVYYVMTKDFSFNVILLSFACVMFVNSILYAHMLMDFDGDKKANKKTLCLKLKTKQNALNFIIVFFAISYILIGYIAYQTLNNLFLLTYITIPMVIELYISLNLFNKNPQSLPHNPFWNHPLDNWDKIKNTYNAPFYSRFYMVRNITTYFMLLACIAIIFG